jgi:hypothetical protein
LLEPIYFKERVMDSEKYCPNCGAKNQPYAAFCVDCENSFIPAPASSSPTPPLPPSDEPSTDEPLYAPPVEPPRRFKKRYILYGVLVLLSLFVVAGAISASQQIANRSVATPTAQASAVAATTPTPEASASIVATATPSVSATPIPTQQSPSPDYATRLNTVGLGAGLVSASPFEKATINGKQAYTGTLIKNGQTYQAQVYPMNSYSEALAFKDQLISVYKSQGYTTYTAGVGAADVSMWYGLSGNTLVGISAMPTSQIDAPVTLVMTATI